MKYIIIALLLAATTTVLSQEKKINDYESIGSYFVNGDTCEKVSYYAALENWLRIDLSEFYVYGNSRRLFSVALRNDTVTIMPTMADSLFSKARVIIVAGRKYELTR